MDGARPGKCPYCPAEYSTRPEMLRHLESKWDHLYERLAASEAEVARLRHVAHLAHTLALCPTYTGSQQEALTALMCGLRDLPMRELAAILDCCSSASKETTKEEVEAMADRESTLAWLSAKSFRIVDDRHPSKRIVEALIEEGRAERLRANRVRATGKVRVGGPGDTGCYARAGKPCSGHFGEGCLHCGRIIGATVSLAGER